MTTPDWVREGTAVECVQPVSPAKRRLFADHLSFPEPGERYVIRGVAVSGDSVGLYLREVVNPVLSWSDGDGEAAWDWRLFRPVTRPRRQRLEEMEYA